MKIEFNLTPEQAEKVKKMLAEENKEWIKEGDDYYSLGSSADSVRIRSWYKDNFDIELLKRANIYRTKESAEQAERQRLALGAIHRYVRENGIRMAGFNGYVPDWDDKYEQKIQIGGWEYSDNCVSNQEYYHFDKSSHGLIFATKEDRRKVLDNCKKELEDLLKVDYSIIR